MGWASGSYLADDVWALVKPHIDPAEQQEVAKELIRAFCGADADDWCDQRLLVDAGYPLGGDDKEIDKFWGTI